MASDDSTDKISVALYIYGERLDPDTITKLLGIQPTSTHRKGDEHGPSDRPYAPKKKTGLWSKAIDPDGGEFEPILEALVDEISPSLPNVLAMPEVELARFDVFVGRMVESDGHTDFAIELSPAALAKLAATGVRINITLATIPR